MRHIIAFVVVFIPTCITIIGIKYFTGNIVLATSTGMTVGLCGVVVCIFSELKTDITKLQTQIADLKRELEEGKQKQHE